MLTWIFHAMIMMSQNFSIIYLFLAPLSLYCCTWILVWWAGALPHCSERVSHCGGFTCGARALGTQASVAVAHRLSDPMTCGIFPDQGSNPCALAGGFLSTLLSGKSMISQNFWCNNRKLKVNCVTYC